MPPIAAAFQTAGPRTQARHQRLRVVVACALAVAGGLTGGCALATRTGPAAPSTGDSLLARAILGDVLNQYMARELEERFDLRLALGQPIDRLPDPSTSHARARGRFVRAAIRRLDDVDIDALSQEDYVTLIAVRVALTNSAEATLHAMNDLTILMPGGSPLRLLQPLFARLPLAAPADVDRYTYLVHAVPFLLDSLRVGVEDRRKRGVVLSKRALARVVPFVRSFADTGAHGPFMPSADQLSKLDSAAARRLRAEIAEAVRRRVAPALDSLVSYLTGAYAANAPAEDGLWQFVGGKQYYGSLVRRWTSLDVTPEQVHEAGLGEVARLDSAMHALRARLGDAADGPAFRDRLSGGTAGGEGATPEALVRRAQEVQSRPAALPDGATVDSLQVGVSITWDALQPPVDRVLGAYRPPNQADPVGRATFGDALRSPAASVMVPAFSYFTMLPGRHRVFAHRVAMSTAVARYYGEVPAFVDGWGMSALERARERGGFATPEEEYGALAFEMVAAARLVVDTGIHYFGWTRQQATELLRRATLLSPEDVELEVTWMAEDAPGAALAAGMGMRELRGVRAWARKELQDRFDDERFERELTSLGPIPLKVLGTHLERWIFEERRQPRTEQVR